ncbi:DUF3489 domain-containing protein [Marimonas arenosa]|uniref:DUF3489 domain-containing protein n=1 Tax=Marimonas arenosa TaxID=1795305 RepID=A0AAE4B692_9RHOB|nr:DUF3489 domain-containing protein [Marimonas arenosa]MDQ2091957.1 DUF3489 domain-containing protein [Marimonas arenosa]
MTTRKEQKPEVAAVKAVSAKPTRQEQLARLLNRKSGASIAQIQKAFGWQPHSARAAISMLRKAGTMIERSDMDKGAVYRIAGEG